MTQQKSERNSNKKTVVIVALLLALIALLCFGGYTFSKYVTSGNGAGEAQVAKWGYTVSVNSSEIFGEKYENSAKADYSKITTADNGLTVKADSANRNLVAPGTTGSMTFTVGGTAEVKAKVVIDFDYTNDVVLNVSKEVKNGEQTETKTAKYNPVKWTLKKGDATVVDGKTLADVKQALATDTMNTTYEAGVTITETTYTLSWAWAFEGTETFDGFTCDELDTLLGQKANGTTVEGYDFGDVVTSIKFTLNVRVEQVAE